MPSTSKIIVFNYKKGVIHLKDSENKSLKIVGNHFNEVLSQYIAKYLGNKLIKLSSGDGLSFVKSGKSLKWNRTGCKVYLSDENPLKILKRLKISMNRICITDNCTVYELC